MGNGPRTANKHDVMVMQESFERAVREGATVQELVEKVPQTVQDTGGNPEPETEADLETPENS